MNTLYLDKGNTQSIDYRDSRDNDSYIVKIDGEQKVVTGFAGFSLNQAQPDPAVIITTVLGKADAELAAMGQVLTDDAGNEVAQVNESTGGEVKNPKLVAKALQKLINKAGRA